MKQKSSKRLSSKGFTLLELLVVVLIIGILVSIALPQYQMAVTKAKVASILPLMRRWKDALQEYKLQHGDYEVSDASTLGVSWPTDWECDNETGLSCHNDYWDCFVNEDGTGSLYCIYDTFSIWMYQPDDPDFEDRRNMITCQASNDYEKGNKTCKALGGNLIGTYSYLNVYKLN